MRQNKFVCSNQYKTGIGKIQAWGVWRMPVSNSMEDAGRQTMAAPSLQPGVARKSAAMDWGITPGRVREAVERIVETANPVRVIAFGSWARGEHTPDSDLDLAVILDEQSTVRDAGKLYECASGIRMSMDILAATLSSRGFEPSGNK